MPPRRESCSPKQGEASTSATVMDEDLPPLARRGIEKEERCAVCLSDYEEDDECLMGFCGHAMHAECLTVSDLLVPFAEHAAYRKRLQAWLKEHAACPVCRRDHAV
jgi:hypothetical protein